MFISVVMAVYNGEAYLEEAVSSILNQTHPYFELIVVNDGSTDRTREILDSIRDPRVRVIHNQLNQGAATSLNIGISQAYGDWIAIHDVDDLSEPNRLEEQAYYLQTHPDSIGVGSLIAGRIGNETVQNSEVDYYNLIMDKQEIYENRFFSCYLCHGSVTFSKKAFYDVGQYNPKYKISYDYDLWMRLFEISPIEKIPKVLYHYRLREDSLGKKNQDQTITELMTISTRYLIKKLKLNNGNGKRALRYSFYVLGTKTGCAFFQKNVPIRFREIHFISYITLKGLRNYKLYKRKGVRQVVILLNNKASTDALNYLTRQGMHWQKNIFKIWNHRF